MMMMKMAIMVKRMMMAKMRKVMMMVMAIYVPSQLAKRPLVDVNSINCDSACGIVFKVFFDIDD